MEEVVLPTNIDNDKSAKANAYEEFLKIEGEEERYVAILDIMGFKQMMEDFPSKKIYEVFCKVDSFKSFVEKNSGPIWITVFSDTIIIVTKGVGNADLFSIIIASTLYLRLFFDMGFALNGGISKGKITVDKNRNIIFGKPIGYAHSLQERLFYYGIAFDNNLDDYWNNIDFSSIIPGCTSPVSRRLIPLKDNKDKNNIQWEEHYHFDIPNLWPISKLKDLFTQHSTIEIKQMIIDDLNQIEQICKTDRAKEYLNNTRNVFQMTCEINKCCDTMLKRDND